MSYIGHRCTRCHHPDIWRLAQRSPAATCDSVRCSCGKCSPGEPELRPTFDLAGRPVERIVVPGQPITKHLPTCGCDACRSLYEQLTAA